VSRAEWDDLVHRVERVEGRRDELLRLRDVHGARLGAIEARLTSIENEVTDGFERLAGWFRELDEKLDNIAGRLP
jgi:hypothetical protein